MYPVSQNYINKLKDISRKTRAIRGTVDNVAFTENDILENSFSYTLIAVKSADIKLGGVFIGKMEMTFLDSFVQRITRGSWKDRVITCEVGLDVGGGTFEYVPIQPFTIDEANHSALGVDIVAYDDMVKFDATINLTDTTGSLYGLVNQACDACSVELGMTEAEIRALPNGSDVYSLYPDSDIETYRDLISWVAVSIGGFATINREGKLVFRNWHTDPDLTIGVNDRFEGGSWSDFQTYYTAVLINYADGTTGYYPAEVDNGLTMEIGMHPLFQYGLPAVRKQRGEAILGAISKLHYTPFKSTSLIDPALDLGDVILYSDGIADDALCCVMRIDFSFSKGATLQGYGKNPSLNGARSAQDKRISQAAAQQKEQGLTYKTFMNADELILDTTFQTLFRIKFQTNESTTVEMWHDIKALCEFEGDTQSIIYEWYFDGEKVQTYEPVDTFSEEGYHTMPHPYWWLNVEGGEQHLWEVRAKTDSGTATIGVNDLHALLKGQKMVAEEAFDGDLPELEDTIEPRIVLGLPLAEITDSLIDLSINAPVPDLSLTDSFTASNRIILGLPIASLTESDGIPVIWQPLSDYITESGDELITENGYTLTTEGVDD